MPRPRTRLRVLVVSVLTLVVSATYATAAHAEPSKAELTAQIDKASTELEDLVESHNRLKEELKHTRESEAKLQEQMKPVQAKLDAAGQQVVSIASQAYRRGGSEAGALLSGPQSGFAERLSLLDYLSRKREREVQTLSAANRDAVGQQRTLATTRQKQEAQIGEMDARKAKIEADLKKLMDLRKRVYGKEQDAGSGYTGAIPQISGAAGKAVAFAYQQIGKPYGWGDDGPGSYDCSGLTLAAWRNAGKSLPHNAAMQHGKVTNISRSALKPGDLVFYRNDGHVGLYVGNNKIIDAPHAGTYVAERSINIMPPTGYGRVR